MKLFTIFGTAAILSVASVGALADSDEAISTDKLVAAIEAATQAHPGNVGDVEVDSEKDKLVVEVDIYATDGSKKEVKVDAESGQVINR